jgi:arylsulfatase A-like enzyme
VDFGHPSRHKHTLGDWRSGWHGDSNKNGHTFSYGTGKTSFVLFDTLPEEQGAGLRIVIRAQATVPGKLRVFVDDVALGSLDFSTSEFGTGEILVPGGLTAGQHTLSLRASGQRTVESGVSASFAVDFVRFEYGEPCSRRALTSYDSLALPPSSPETSGFALHPGDSATIYVVPPPKGLLTGSARSVDGAQARLIVSTRLDGEPEVQLASLSLAAAPQPFSLPLDDVGGKPMALTLTAQEGAVALGSPAIQVPSTVLEKPSGKPVAQNVVIVLIDTLRADRVAAYSPKTRVKADAMHALAQESALFERMTVAENWTKPSVASLLSGLYPSTHGAKGSEDKLPSSVLLLSEHLKARGYDTAGFVANGYVSSKFGFERGWKTWTNYVREGKRNRAEFVLGEAGKWLETRKADKPFFLYVHTIDPHVPYFPPRRYVEMYDSQPYDGPIEGAKTAHQLGKIKGKGMVINERDKQRLEALYDGEVTYHDDQLALFVEKMRQLGFLENTALIVTSDHGEEFFDHGSVGHGHSLWEEMIHAPFMVRLPGAQAGKSSRIAHETTNVDVFPTVCELLGVEIPAEVEGRSLVPLLKGERLPGAPSASFSEFLAGQRSVRAASYKAIFRSMKAELFDLEADPRETRDVAQTRPIAMSMLRDLLGARLGAQNDLAKSDKRKRHRQEKAIMDEETKQQLRALGYLQD